MRGFTLVEVLITLVIVIIVVAILAPFFRTSFIAWQFSDRRTEVLQNGRIGLDRITQEIERAARFIDVSDSTTTTGFITILNKNGERITFSRDTVNNTLKINGEILAEVVTSLRFTCYDTMQNPTTNPANIRSVEIEMTVTDREGKIEPITLFSRAFKRMEKQSLEINKFLLTSFSAIGTMTDTSCTTSLRFTSQETITINRIRVYLHQEVGASPTYRYGVRTDSGGIPADTWAGPTRRGYRNLAATAAGWQILTLLEPVSLSKGDTYHIVIGYVTGTIGSRYISIRCSDPLNYLIPFANTPDLKANVLWNTSTPPVWQIKNSQPIYVLEKSTLPRYYEGNPYEISSLDQQIYGTNCRGEIVTISGGDRILTDVGTYVKKNSTDTPADHLYYEIRNSGNQVQRSGLLVPSTVITTDFTWFDTPVSPPLTLVDGSWYRIVFKSPGSNSVNYYQIMRLDNTDAPVYNSINYQGVNTRYCISINSGSTWTNYNYQDTVFRYYWLYP